MEQLTTIGQFELYAATDADVDRIAAAMIDLAAALRDVLIRVAQDESALPELRGAARLVRPATHNIWMHFGGDGGW